MAEDSAITSWTAVEHPVFKRAIAVVGLNPRGEVVAVIPLYDARDADYSGKVTFGEHLASFLLNGIGPQAQQAEVLRIVALDMADAGLKQEADRKLLNAGFKVAYRQLQKIYVTRLLGSAAGAVLDRTALAVIPRFFVKQGFERAFDAALARVMTRSGR